MLMTALSFEGHHSHTGFESPAQQLHDFTALRSSNFLWLSPFPIVDIIMISQDSQDVLVRVGHPGWSLPSCEVNEKPMAKMTWNPRRREGCGDVFSCFRYGENLLQRNEAPRKTATRPRLTMANIMVSCVNLCWGWRWAFHVGFYPCRMHPKNPKPGGSGAAKSRQPALPIAAMTK